MNKLVSGNRLKNTCYVLDVWAIRWIRSEHLIYNKVSVVDTRELYNCNLLRVELKCSHTNKLNIFGDGYV